MRRQDSKSTIAIVSLAEAAAANENEALNTNPPGGITHAVEMVSGSGGDNYGFVEPYILWPTATQSGARPRPNPAPVGMFNGVSGLASMVPFASAGPLASICGCACLPLSQLPQQSLPVARQSYPQVLAKTFMLHSTMRISYVFYKSHGASDKQAPAMRLRLYSPSKDLEANLIWVRAPAIGFRLCYSRRSSGMLRRVEAERCCLGS